MNKVIESGIGINRTMVTIIKGFVISIIISLISIFIFAIVVSYTDFSENSVAPVMIGITALSILIGTSISTLKLNKNGIVNGGIIGLLYITTLYLISSTIGAGFGLNINAIIMMVLSIVAGMIGRNCRSKYKSLKI